MSAIDQVETLLAPILAGAAEKAAMLARECGAPGPVGEGLRPALRRLRAALGEEAVGAGAERLIARLAAEHSQREPVR